MQLASLEIRMARCENLPTLPQAASAVLRLADDPNASALQVERAIEKDPAMAAKLLKVANSAYYGSLKVPSLNRAITVLGMSTVRSAVVGLAMQQMAVGRSLCPSFDRVAFWRHSLAVATAARIIGKIRVPSKAEELYCAGMMHDIGLLAMEKFAPDELQRSLDQARSSGIPLVVCEQSVCGFTHVHVGTVLADRWGLTSMVKSAIALHQSPFDHAPPSEAALAVALADAVAGKAGFGYPPQSADSVTIDPRLFQALGVNVQQTDAVCEVVNLELQRAQESFCLAA